MQNGGTASVTIAYFDEQFEGVQTRLNGVHAIKIVIFIHIYTYTLADSWCLKSIG